MRAVSRSSRGTPLVLRCALPRNPAATSSMSSIPLSASVRTRRKGLGASLFELVRRDSAETPSTSPEAERAGAALWYLLGLRAACDPPASTCPCAASVRFASLRLVYDGGGGGGGARSRSKNPTGSRVDSTTLTMGCSRSGLLHLDVSSLRMYMAEARQIWALPWPGLRSDPPSPCNTTGRIAKPCSRSQRSAWSSGKSRDSTSSR
mmetsp:Transcript_47769/g.126431  ORF Transcript_47769/g.126431 Transcript_47769/m.126431 type:complete len:206 (+) Transcript_47769:1161-1778(+)